MLPHLVLDEDGTTVEAVLVPLRRWKIRWAAWQCFRGTPISSSSIRSMTPVKGSGLGRSGGFCRRYPGGTKKTGILRTAFRYNPNTWEVSQVLIPSTLTARRTRRTRTPGTSIPPTIGSTSNLWIAEGGPVFKRRKSAICSPSWYNLTLRKRPAEAGRFRTKPKPR